MKLVLVEWVDIHRSRGWNDLETIQQGAEPLYCRSVGWLVHDGKETKSIVPHIAGEKNGDVILQGCGDLTIPNKAIVKMTTLKSP